MEPNSGSTNFPSYEIQANTRCEEQCRKCPSFSQGLSLFSENQAVPAKSLLQEF